MGRVQRCRRVGYWLWDVVLEEIYRCVMVPRGTVVLSGGSVKLGDKSFTLRSDLGSTGFGVLQNPQVDEHASTTNFEITITVGDDTWSYNETMDVYISRLGKQMQHKDGNTLTRVAE